MGEQASSTPPFPGVRPWTMCVQVTWDGQDFHVVCNASAASDKQRKALVLEGARIVDAWCEERAGSGRVWKRCGVMRVERGPCSPDSARWN
jgi:hypothetical protein